VTDVICVAVKPPRPTWVTRTVAANEEKKTDEGSLMWPPELKPNPTAAPDPPEAQTSTRAATKGTLDILTNCKIFFEIAHKI
jgi:hypothetical protein